MTTIPWNQFRAMVDPILESHTVACHAPTNEDAGARWHIIEVTGRMSGRKRAVKREIILTFAEGCSSAAVAAVVAFLEGKRDALEKSGLGWLERDERLMLKVLQCFSREQ